jgi:hypothetical protein
MNASLAYRFVLGALVAQCSVSTIHQANAHEPLDISSRITVYRDRIELTSTLGVDAARQLLTVAGVSSDAIAQSLRGLHPDLVVEHATTVALHLFQLAHDGDALAATRVTSQAEGMEILFTLVYPRPAGGRLEALAVCYETIPDLRRGSLMIVDETAGNIGAVMLWRENQHAGVMLPAAIVPPPMEQSEAPPAE